MSSQNYDANSISVLEGLEAVRKRPGMYIGSVSTKGLNHLIYEIVDNSVDEFLAGHCNEITVTLKDDGTAVIEDNGRGDSLWNKKKNSFRSKTMAGAFLSESMNRLVFQRLRWCLPCCMPEGNSETGDIKFREDCTVWGHLWSTPSLHGLK